MFLSEWREFPSAPCLAKKNFMTARVSMLLKSRVFLTCLRASFLPGRTKDLSARRYNITLQQFSNETLEVCGLDSSGLPHGSTVESCKQVWVLQKWGLNAVI
jgi:hypothetical protein